MVVNSLGFSIESRGLIGRFWISPIKTSGRNQNLPLVLLMFISLQSLSSYLVGILDIFRVVVFLQIDFVYSSL